MVSARPGARRDAGGEGDECERGRMAVVVVYGCELGVGGAKWSCRPSCAKPPAS